MSPALARPLLHTAHLLTFALLFATGLLLLLPGLRIAVTGGHSQLLRTAHRWGGVAFVVLPLLIMVRCGARSLAAAPAARTLRTLWQGGHVALTVVMSVVFTLTGAAIWAQRLLPEAAGELCRSTHDWLTYAAGCVVAAHLLEVGTAALVARVRAAAADSSA
jgi:cytochrome b subunit of formate dehydrogenase